MGAVGGERREAGHENGRSVPERKRVAQQVRQRVLPVPRHLTQKHVETQPKSNSARERVRGRTNKEREIIRMEGEVGRKQAYKCFS